MRFPVERNARHDEASGRRGVQSRRYGRFFFSLSFSLLLHAACLVSLVRVEATAFCHKHRP